MSWLRIDDRVADDPRVLDAGDALLGALVRLGAWSARHLTDGALPPAAVRVLVVPRVMNALVAAGFIVADGDGYRMRSDLIHIRPAVDVQADRAAAAQRQAASRARRSAARHGVTSGTGHSVGHDVTSSVTHAVTGGVSHAVSSPVSHGCPDPTRPDLPSGDEKQNIPTGARETDAHDMESSAPAAVEPPPSPPCDVKRVEKAVIDAMKILAPSAGITLAFAELGEQAGQLADPPLDPTEYAIRAVDVYRRWREAIPDQRRRPGWAPHKIREHWDRIQSMVNGVEPVEMESTSPSSPRRLGRARGVAPVADWTGVKSGEQQ